VFTIQDSHFWVWNNPRVLCKNGYQAHFSISGWAGVIRDIVVGPYLLPDGLTAQYHVFLENVVPGLLDDVPLAVRQMLWFQHDGAPVHHEDSSSG
jgi:hypothetical protein